MQSNFCRSSAASASAPVETVVVWTSPSPIRLDDHGADGRIVLDHQQVLDRAIDEAFQQIERLAE